MDIYRCYVPDFDKKNLLDSTRQEQSVSKRLQYVRTTRPTQSPLCVALSFGDTATLRTAQAALSVIKKEHV